MLDGGFQITDGLDQFSDRRKEETCQLACDCPRGSIVTNTASIWARVRDLQSEDKDAADLKDIDDIRRRLYVLIYHAVYQNKSSNKAHLNGLS